MQIHENFSLKNFNTFGIDASAALFAAFTGASELQELVQGNAGGKRPVLILGGGSNVLFTGNINALVLKNEIGGIEIIAEDADYVYVKAGAGEPWHRFVLFCIENNLGGVENLSLIPGSVGASPMQNIGAYGVEVKDVFHELEAFHLTDKKIVRFDHNDCAFGYRESIFKKKYKGAFVILTVTCRLLKTPCYNTSYGAIEQELQRMHAGTLSIQAISQAIINIRRSKLPDPEVTGNAGSFFKNPEVSAAAFTALKNNIPGIIGYPAANNGVKLAAGWMIEQCGWKGYRNGDAGCYAKQALVLVNYGNANGREIYDLSEAILQSVYKKFGVQLEREVNLIGEL